MVPISELPWSRGTGTHGLSLLIIADWWWNLWGIDEIYYAASFGKVTFFRVFVLERVQVVFESSKVIGWKERAVHRCPRPKTLHRVSLCLMPYASCFMPCTRLSYFPLPLPFHFLFLFFPFLLSLIQNNTNNNNNRSS